MAHDRIQVRGARVHNLRNIDVSLPRNRLIVVTGLSGSGKTTIAKVVKSDLIQKNKKVLILDGDNIRDTQHKHLGFSPEDIKTNNILITELCLDNILNYDVVIVPIISPYKESRIHARNVIGKTFYEIYIKTSLSTLEKRDTKGLYSKQKKGLINNLIGVSSANLYEEPISPDLIVETNLLSIKKSSNILIKFIEDL